MPKTKTVILVKRRAKRGRPRKGEDKVKLAVAPVFIARDPQGIKLFSAEPRLSVIGLWEGRMVPGLKPMEPRTFVSKYRNARLPERGDMLRMEMGT